MYKSNNGLVSTIRADLSTCNWSLLWDVGVFNSVSTEGACLHTTREMRHHCLPKNHEILGSAPLWSSYNQWEEMRDSAFSGLQFSFRPQNWMFLHSQNWLKLPVVWLGKSVVLTDIPWEMKPPLWDYEITPETVSLTVTPWELRDLFVHV